MELRAALPRSTCPSGARRVQPSESSVLGRIPSGGLHPVLQPGLGRLEHIRQSLAMVSPVAAQNVVDDDVRYAVRQVAV